LKAIKIIKNVKEFDPETKAFLITELTRFSKTQKEQTASKLNDQKYLETLLKIPWIKYSKNVLDISKSKSILNRNHFGLEKVK